MSITNMQFLKIQCFCGEDFEFKVYRFPETLDKDYVRRPCPKCKRSYDLKIIQVRENEKFWL